MSNDDQILEEFTSKEYEFGWTVDLEADEAPKGLNEDIIHFISKKKEEPKWLLEWRLEAFRVWQKMTEPKWSNVDYQPVDYQDLIYYSAPKQKTKPKSLDEVDPELLATFEKLGISLTEQKRLTGIAVDAVIDSVSVATTFKDTLAELGIIFCSFSEAVQEHPELVKKHFVELKKYLSSSMFTSLHENAGKNQKSPLINLVRQVLKWLGYELNPKRLSDGYSEDGKKRYRRIFIIKKIEKRMRKREN